MWPLLTHIHSVIAINSYSTGRIQRLTIGFLREGSQELTVGSEDFHSVNNKFSHIEVVSAIECCVQWLSKLSNPTSVCTKT